RHARTTGAGSVHDRPATRLHLALVAAPPPRRARDELRAADPTWAPRPASRDLPPCPYAGRIRLAGSHRAHPATREAPRPHGARPRRRLRFGPRRVRRAGARRAHPPRRGRGRGTRPHPPLGRGGVEASAVPGVPRGPRWRLRSGDANRPWAARLGFMWV